MLILFDQSAPAPLRLYLKSHTVVEARERRWGRLVNGELLDVAEAAGFEVFLTADKNLRYQQNLTGRKIAIVVIGSAQWPATAAARIEERDFLSMKLNIIPEERRPCGWCTIVTV
jgi:hypothetical protein